MIDKLDTFYHYCSLDNFIKILKSQSIWLSHARTVDDCCEDKAFLKTIDEVVGEHFNDNPIEEQRVINMVVNEYKSRIAYPYFACFSADGDCMSQWLRYADNARGAAIGFDISKFSFRDLMDVPYGTQTPVVTMDEVSYKDCDNVIYKLLSAALLSYGQTKDFEVTVNRTTALLNDLYVFNKNKCLADEKEIRMVYNPDYRHLLASVNQENYFAADHLDIKFRTLDNDIASYFEYSLPEDAIKSVVLGPKSHIDSLQLTLLLARYAPRVRIENAVTRSKIEYK